MTNSSISSISNDKLLQAKIEAALYAAGRPLSKFELAKAAGITSTIKSSNIARHLMSKINSTFEAIQMFELEGERFVIQLKSDFTTSARKFSSRPLLSTAELKTLSFIVYFQPISGKDLADRRGPNSYQHVRTLKQLGFIKSEPSGRTKIFSTTSRLAEYFGIANDPAILKQQLVKYGFKPKKAQVIQPSPNKP